MLAIESALPTTKKMILNHGLKTNDLSQRKNCILNIILMIIIICNWSQIKQLVGRRHRQDTLNLTFTH